METILIATDFSPAGRNATHYGFEFAKAIKAKVILFNAYQFPAAHPESLVYYPVNDLEKSNYRQLAIEAETIDPHARVALETQSRQGPVIDSILTVAHENNASFIIVGMKKHGKEIRKYFGSTVTFLKKKSFIPIIVVPEEANFSIPKKIALASDINNDTNYHILHPLKKIAEMFSSKLYVVHVIKKSMDEAVERLMRTSGITWSLKSLQPVFKFPMNDNVTKAINDFVRGNAVDMVAVIPHEHDLMERIFTRSITKDLVFHTQIPLLILPSPHAGNAEIKSEVLRKELPVAV